MVFKRVLSLLAFYFVVPTVLSRFQNNVPLCPPKSLSEAQQKLPYVVYGYNPPQCYVASRTGPCSEGSILFAKPKSHLGVCSCECFLSEGIVFDDSSISRYRYCFNQRSLGVYVYDKKRCACYRMGTQGPCPPGQILEKGIYEDDPKCVREDSSTSPTTIIEDEKCPPGTIYSTLLNECTDMNFHGLPTTTTDASSEGPTTTGRPTGSCPPGTIYSTLLNICTDMMFTGLPPSGSRPTSERPQGSCPPGTIYSTLLNICTDMSFTGLPPSGNRPTTERPQGGTCPPGTIYSTLLNICTDMSFTGLPPNGNGPTTERPQGRCPPGTIYSTLLNICTDMNFRGLKPNATSSSWRQCPRGTIYSTLLNRCTDMNFRGLIKNAL